MSTSNFVEYDPIAAAKGFTELPPEQSKGKSRIDQLRIITMNLAAKKNAKKKAAKARKNAEAKKAENEVVEDIAGLFLYVPNTVQFCSIPFCLRIVHMGPDSFFFQLLLPALIKRKSTIRSPKRRLIYLHYRLKKRRNR